MNLLLCGFMGCGKSTVGKRLSEQMHLDYLDLDQQIEQHTGLSIPQIFSQYGEAYFRELEHQQILSLSNRDNCIVSTGGGALTFARNLSTLSPNDRVIFLDADFDTCYARIDNSDRPIVQQKSKEQLHALFIQRKPFYLQAAQKGWVINANCSVDEICANISPLIDLS